MVLLSVFRLEESVSSDSPPRMVYLAYSAVGNKVIAEAARPTMPANNAMPETQTKISETQSESRPVSAPVQPMEMTPPPIEQSAPQIEQTAP